MSLHRVSQLFIYPIKSLGGIALTISKVLYKGLQYDRRWMLVDSRNQFMTQRTFSALALFKLRMEEQSSHFVIDYKGATLTIPFTATGALYEAIVWDDVVKVQEVSPEVSKWFSHHLGQTVKLVWFPEENKRYIDYDFAQTMQDQTSLSDGYPILLVGQASLNDLNGRLENPVSMDRFRPNIVFEGGTPFEEDTYTHFSINGVKMVGVKPCARCVITTIDQTTGTKGKEPLATLNAYRNAGNKVLFGQNVIPTGEGTIQVGDEISLG